MQQSELNLDITDIPHKRKNETLACDDYHANRMDARCSQFDLGRVDAYI